MPSRLAVRSISIGVGRLLTLTPVGAERAGSGRPVRTRRNDRRSRSAVVTRDGTVLMTSSASRMWMLVR